MKKNINLFLYSIVMIVITSGISVFASGLVNSNDVGYCRDNDNNPVTVREAIDTLYDSVEVTTILPVGSVVSYMGTTAPTNYLLCDGTVYNINDYKKLADHIKDNFGSYNYFGGNGTTTFAVPDLRGEFLRGAGTNSRSNQGSGSTVGTHQDATLVFNHVLLKGSTPRLYEYYNADDSTSPIGSGNADSYLYASNTTQGYANLTPSSLGKTAVYHTTRPTNTSVNYIIKVK